MFRLILFTFGFLNSIESIRYSHADFRPLMTRRRLIWKKQFNIDDPQNWYPVKEFPCPQDTVVFPENYVVFLNRRLIVSQLILPINGEIVLSKEGIGAIEFSLPDEQENEEFFASNNMCKLLKSGRTLYFQPEANYEQHNSWFNPFNWHVAFEFDTTGPTSSTYQISNYATFHLQQTKSKSISLIPDSERIPCMRDFVDFPTNGSWKVKIGKETQLIPKLVSLSIGYLSQFRTEKFRSFVSSFIGQMLFDIQGYNHMELDPLSLTCRASQCACGNDEPNHMAQICSQIHYCPTPLCHDPIKPIGFCCPICGSNLIISLNQIDDNRSWNIYNQLSKTIDQIYKSDNENKLKISLYVHWLYNGDIQVIIANVDSNSFLSSEHYLARLVQILNNHNAFKTLNMTKQFSRQWKIDSTFINFVVFLVILFLILILSIIGYLMYNYQQRNRIETAFTFVRFRSGASDVELELDNPGLADDNILSNFQFSGLSTSPKFADNYSIPDLNIEKISKSFRNFVARVGGQSSSATTLMPQCSSKNHLENEFDNPMFKLNDKGKKNTS